MEQGDQLSLQVGAHVDHAIATTDQIEPRERRILDHILFGKDQDIADGLLHAIVHTLRFQQEESG